MRRAGSYEAESRALNRENLLRLIAVAQFVQIRVWIFFGNVSNLDRTNSRLGQRTDRENSRHPAQSLGSRAESRAAQFVQIRGHILREIQPFEGLILRGTTYPSTARVTILETGIAGSSGENDYYRLLGRFILRTFNGIRRLDMPTAKWAGNEILKENGVGPDRHFFRVKWLLNVYGVMGPRRPGFFFWGKCILTIKFGIKSAA
ncbi:hypothetical protein BDZ89DRAFT_1043937 [Hymenopellis radicata]|nr:hypothetical protein BDZ89DRAFT_1043937 [Hymenopellis radicata]